MNWEKNPELRKYTMKTLNKRKNRNTLQANKHKYVLGERLVLNNKLTLQVGGGLIGWLNPLMIQKRKRKKGIGNNE